MTADWRASTWGDEISLEYGKGLKGYKDNAGHIQVFGSNGPIGWHNKELATGPGIILGRKGAYRGIHYSKKPFYVIDTAYYVKTKSDLDIAWLFYAMKHHRLGEIDDGSPIPSTTRAAVYVCELKIPPKSDQEKIGSLLRSFDDKIDLNQQMNKTLEEMAQAIFKCWFVDFEPTRAKMAGESEESICKRLNLTPDILALFPAILTSSALGPIPEGWNPKRLDAILELAYGKALKKSDRIDGEIPVYGSGGITGSHNNAIVDGPGIIIGRKGTVGSIYWEDNSFYPIDTVFYVRTTRPLNHVFFELQTLGLEEMNTDAAVPGLNRNNVYRLETPDYPKELINEFDSLASSMRNQITANHCETKTLTDIRDTLLPKLLSGELSVDNIELEID